MTTGTLQREQSHRVKQDTFRIHIASGDSVAMLLGEGTVMGGYLKRFLQPIEEISSPIIRAKRYRQKFGDPVDHLNRFFDDLITDEALWDEVMTTPYG